MLTNKHELVGTTVRDIRSDTDGIVSAVEVHNSSSKVISVQVDLYISYLNPAGLAIRQGRWDWKDCRIITPQLSGGRTAKSV